MTPLPASDASRAISPVYATLGRTESVTGTSSAMKARSVSIHWPQSSTMSASFTPLGLTVGVAVGESAGPGDDDATDVAIDDGNGVGDATGSGATVATRYGVGEGTLATTRWNGRGRGCRVGRSSCQPAKAAKIMSKVSASPVLVREPERREDRLGTGQSFRQSRISPS
jgi:hypothetical protein